MIPLSGEVRQPVTLSVPEAVDYVEDGMTIGIGGFINSSHPMVVVRELIRRGRKNLTVVGAASSGLEIDMLIAGGCCNVVISPYVGGEGLAAVGPCFRRAAERGEIVIKDMDEALYYAGLRAAAQGLPFNPWRSGVGTDFPVLNPDLKVFDDPIRNEPLLAVPAIDIDVAFTHAGYADMYGNVRHVGTGWGDRAQFAAADKTFVQVEQLISNEEIRRNPAATSLPGVAGVMRCPYGAHPFASPGFYTQDVEHLKGYLTAATVYQKENRRGPLDDYLNKFVYGPNDAIEYLDAVGLRSLLNLSEY